MVTEPLNVDLLPSPGHRLPHLSPGRRPWRWQLTIRLSSKTVNRRAHFHDLFAEDSRPIFMRAKSTCASTETLARD